jgi:predicted esterase
MIRAAIFSTFLVALSSPALAAPSKITTAKSSAGSDQTPRSTVCPFPADWQRSYFEASIVPEDAPLAEIIQEEAAIPCNMPVPGLPSHTVSCDPDGVVGGGFAFVPVSGKPDSTVLFLHGLLSQVADPPIPVGFYVPFLTSVVNAAAGNLKNTRVLFPMAPIRNITSQLINPNLRLGRAWFDIVDFAMPNASLAEIAALQFDTLGLYRAGERIAEIVQEEQDIYRIPARKVFLLGHSLGGFLTLHVSLLTDISFAGVASLAGALPQTGDFLGPAASRVVNPRGKEYDFLMIHGTEDETVPFPVGKVSAAIVMPIVEAFGQMLTFTSKVGLDHVLRLLVDESVIASVSSTIVKSFKFLMTV